MSPRADIDGLLARLTSVARRAEVERGERDRLIRLLRARSVPLRQIAAAAALSHTRVRQIAGR